ncbi:hypothetical protein GH733_013874, partial [Mirounga leonina]
MPGNFPGGMPGMAGGMPGMAGMPGLNEILSDPEVLAAMQDPEVMVAFQDVAQNPANMSKYQSNPKVMNLISKLSSKFGGTLDWGQHKLAQHQLKWTSIKEPVIFQDCRVFFHSAIHTAPQTSRGTTVLLGCLKREEGNGTWKLTKPETLAPTFEEPKHGIQPHNLIDISPSETSLGIQ